MDPVWSACFQGSERTSGRGRTACLRYACPPPDICHDSLGRFARRGGGHDIRGRRSWRGHAVRPLAQCSPGVLSGCGCLVYASGLGWSSHTSQAAEPRTGRVIERPDRHVSQINGAVTALTNGMAGSLLQTTADSKLRAAVEKADRVSDDDKEAPRGMPATAAQVSALRAQMVDPCMGPRPESADGGGGGGGAARRCCRPLLPAAAAGRMRRPLPAARFCRLLALLARRCSCPSCPARPPTRPRVAR